MANPSKKKKTEKTEVVAYFDHESINIENLICTIRGQKVMVDFDLAMLYGVQNKRLNEQVKRNKERFPNDFMFQLTHEEWNVLRSQFAATKTPEYQTIALLRSQFATTKDLSKIRTLPYVFKSNTVLFKRVFHLEQHQQETDEKINYLIAKMDDISPKLLTEQIFATGCIWDAWSYVSDLVRSAKQRIVLIDNFVDDRVLSLLDKRGEGVEATIHSRYSDSFLTDLQKYNAQQREIKFTQLPHKNHDRFLIIDDDVFLLGASVKDMGIGLCAITKMQTTPETILKLLK